MENKIKDKDELTIEEILTFEVDETNLEKNSGANNLCMDWYPYTEAIN